MEMDLSKPEAVSTATVDELRPNQVMIQTTPPDPALQKSEQPLEAPTAEQQQPETPTEEKTVEEVAEAAGLNVDAIKEEFLNAGGSISQETRDSIVKAMETTGITADEVDNYFRGQQAIRENMELKVMMAVGGEESWNELKGWAATNLSQEELNAYNALTEGGDEANLIKAAKLLQTQMRQSSNTGGQRVKATSGSVPSGPLFRSMKELAAAQSQPGFASSPTMQEEVRQRLIRSLNAGVFKN